MNALKTWKTDITFMLLGSITILLYYQRVACNVERGIVLAGNLLLAFLVVRCYPLKVKDDIILYKSKKCIGIFIIISLLTLIIGCTLTRYIMPSCISLTTKTILYRLATLVLTLSLLICYIFGVKLSNYRWNINIKMLVLLGTIIIMYRLIPIITIIAKGGFIFNLEILKDGIRQGITLSFYPSILEEVLYRGFFISGLRGFGLSDNKSNIVQAVMFGAFHIIFRRGIFSWIDIFSYTCQMLMGYVLGKLYFKTKSLTPCILLHGLMDVELPIF